MINYEIIYYLNNLLISNLICRLILMIKLFTNDRSRKFIIIILLRFCSSIALHLIYLFSLFHNFNYSSTKIIVFEVSTRFRTLIFLLLVIICVYPLIIAKIYIITIFIHIPFIVIII